jgi:hypothetical protein
MPVFLPSGYLKSKMAPIVSAVVVCVCVAVKAFLEGTDNLPDTLLLKVAGPLVVLTRKEVSL